MLDATPELVYEGYSPSLSPFGGSDDEPERFMPFGFVPAPHPDEPSSWWDDCGVVD